MIGFLEAQNTAIVLDSDFPSPAAMLCDRNTMLINPNCIDMYEELIVHEGFHALQSKRNLSKSYYNQSFQENMLQRYMTEAGAISYAAMVLFEMKLNGYEAAFDQRKTEPAHIKYMNYFHRYYEQNYYDVLGQGAKHKQALLESGQKLFNETFMCRMHLEEYMQTYLKCFINDMDKYAEHTVIEMFNNSAPWHYGNIDDERSLGQDITLAEVKALVFDNNKDIQSALDWLNHIRLFKHHKENKDHFSVILSYQKMQRSKNPYTDISFDDFETAFIENMDKQASEQKTVIALLDALSGDEAVNQKPFDFSKPFPSKRSVG